MGLTHHVLEGSATERGHHCGEVFCLSLKNLIPQRLDHLAECLGLRPSALKGRFEDEMKESFKSWQRACPPAAMEFQATAEASGQDLWALSLAANLTDYRDSMDDEGCTSLVAKDFAGKVWFSQTWDLGVENLEHVVAVTRRYEGFQQVAICCSGFPPLMGMNSEGLCWGTTNLKTRDRGVGWGYQWILSSISWSHGLEDALSWVGNSPRAGSHTYLLSQEDQALQLDAGHVFFAQEVLSKDYICRTNHAQHQELRAVELEPPNASTTSRMKRVASWWQENPDVNLATLKGLLTNRDDGTNSISRRREDGTGITTNACLIAKVDERQLWLSHGHGDGEDWLHFDLRMNDHE